MDAKEYAERILVGLEAAEERGMLPADGECITQIPQNKDNSVNIYIDLINGQAVVVTVKIVDRITPKPWTSGEIAEWAKPKWVQE